MAEELGVSSAKSALGNGTVSLELHFLSQHETGLARVSIPAVPLTSEILGLS